MVRTCVCACVGVCVCVCRHVCAHVCVCMCMMSESVSELYVAISNADTAANTNQVYARLMIVSVGHAWAVTSTSTA